jgi:hypothetical protein
MNNLETFLSWSIFTFEVALCGFLFTRKVHRILPFFTAYATMLLANMITVWFAYHAFGLFSVVSYYCYWISILANAGMRSLAIAELCRFKLGGYRGLWELVWRALAGLSVLFLLHAAFDTWGQPNRFAIYSLTFDRDLDIASVGILGTLLLIHNYYGLSLEPLQRTIAAGICFISAVDIIGDTILRGIYTGYLFPMFTANRTSLWYALKPYFEYINDIWGTVHLFCFMAAIGIWCYALRKPVPAASESPALLPAEVYRELSPAINLRLATFNDRLVELMKP